MLRTWRFVTLLLVALGLTLGAAHVLELPPKMQHDGEMYAAVTSTLYRLFGSIGAMRNRTATSWALSSSSALMPSSTPPGVGPPRTGCSGTSYPFPASP